MHTVSKKLQINTLNKSLSPKVGIWDLLNKLNQQTLFCLLSCHSPRPLAACWCSKGDLSSWSGLGRAAGSADISFCGQAGGCKKYADGRETADGGGRVFVVEPTWCVECNYTPNPQIPKSPTACPPALPGPPPTLIMPTIFVLTWVMSPSCPLRSCW